MFTKSAIFNSQNPALRSKRTRNIPTDIKPLHRSGSFYPIGVYKYQREIERSIKGRRTEFSTYFNVSGMYEDTSIDAATKKQERYKKNLEKKILKIKQKMKEIIKKTKNKPKGLALEEITAEKQFPGPKDTSYLEKVANSEFHVDKKENTISTTQGGGKSLLSEGSESNIINLLPKIIKIQTLIRGFLARKNFKLTKAERDEELLKLTKAVIVIQKYYRGYLARKGLSQRMMAKIHSNLDSILIGDESNLITRVQQKCAKLIINKWRAHAQLKKENKRNRNKNISNHRRTGLVMNAQAPQIKHQIRRNDSKDRGITNSRKMQRYASQEQVNMSAFKKPAKDKPLLEKHQTEQGNNYNTGLLAGFKDPTGFKKKKEAKYKQGELASPMEIPKPLKIIKFPSIAKKRRSYMSPAIEHGMMHKKALKANENTIHTYRTDRKNTKLKKAFLASGAKSTKSKKPKASKLKSKNSKKVQPTIVSKEEDKSGVKDNGNGHLFNKSLADTMNATNADTRNKEESTRFGTVQKHSDKELEGFQVNDVSIIQGHRMDEEHKSQDEDIDLLNHFDEPVKVNPIQPNIVKQRVAPRAVKLDKPHDTISLDILKLNQ
ncbi:unnamed protein product [Moneuplotes crassus]|uniref:Uncharacterized protein n=1 Tax=Euplotes crassus TaxID=5936 RepID=A0AAD1YAQ2_EUPCR|nr:unnamed protein product [Moneuplotes crassus]